MGIEPFLVTSSIIGIVAQRLVRALCSKCKELYSPTQVLIKEMELERPKELFRNKGCAACKNTGFIGRFAISELLVMSDELRGMVSEKKSAGEIQKAAARAGMKLLLEDGIEKAKAGLTTLEEVLRVATV